MSNEPSNAAVELADYAAKKLIIDVLTEKAIALAIAESPWLGAAFINPVFVFLMQFAGKYLYRVLSLEAAFIIIDKQVGHQVEKYEAEVKELKEAIKQGKSDEEIKREHEEAKKRLRDLINFNS